MDLVERHFFVSILVKVFNKEPTTFETYVYLLGSRSEAKAYTFTIQFSSQDEVIVKVLNHYNILIASHVSGTFVSLLASSLVVRRLGKVLDRQEVT